MDPTGPVARRFPLIARPRPPCTALPPRISALLALADRAADANDPVIASCVHNQAALIASDCGQPDLARTWCHRHARAHLDSPRPDAHAARQTLEPLVNLARLHIRAGNGAAAFALIDSLYQAVLTRTDTVIDGIAVPAARLTSAPDSHAQLTRWLWTIHLADGTRALAGAGQWNDAEAHLQRHNGIGRRMLDGRQVAVIARLTRGNRAEALHLLTGTEPGQPWETAVAACLTALTRPDTEPLPSSQLTTMIDWFRRLPSDPTLVLFRTRLALSTIDAIGDMNLPAAQSSVRDLIRAVLDSSDGYAARDLLAHRPCMSLSSVSHTDELATVVHYSGLDQPLPAALTSQVQAALATSERIITGRATAQLEESPSQQSLVRGSTSRAATRFGWPLGRSSAGRSQDRPAAAPYGNG